MEHLCEIMKECNWVYDVEIPERISKATMERYQEVKNANKPKKGKKGGKGKKNHNSSKSKKTSSSKRRNGPSFNAAKNRMNVMGDLYGSLA